MRSPFQPLEKFLIKNARLAAALLVALAPAAAIAEMSYNRIDVSYVDADYDDTDVDGDGIELAASYLLNEQVFLHGRWLEEDLDFDVDGSFFEIGVGLRKADEKVLGKKFNDAIAAVKANGTFKKLNDKYFEYDISGKTAK